MLTSASMSVISVAMHELPLYCVYLWHINQHVSTKCRLNLQNCRSLFKISIVTYLFVCFSENIRERKGNSFKWFKDIQQK
jgi:hypothetical protein